MTTPETNATRELIEDILNSRCSPELKGSLTSSLDEQEKVVKTLEEIKREELYNQIMSKPLMTGWDILNLPCEPNDYLIENFLWRGSISLIVGQEKACKSMITAQKGMAMTCGEPFLGCFDVIHPLKVLYIQAEGSMDETKDRFVNATQESGIKWNPDNWRHYSPAFLCLDTEYGYQDIVDRLKADGFIPDVIVVDPLYTSVTPGKSLSSDELVRPFCGNLRRLQHEYKCAIIIVHHEHRSKHDRFGNKIEEGDDAVFGSSMLKNFSSHTLRISIVNERGNPIAPEKEGKIKYRKLACATQRNGNVIKKVMLRLSENPLMLKVMGPKLNSTTEDAVFNYIKKNKGIAACDVAEQTGIPEQTVRNCFSSMKSQGKICISGKDGRKVLYKVKGD